MFDLGRLKELEEATFEACEPFVEMRQLSSELRAARHVVDTLRWYASSCYERHVEDKLGYLDPSEWLYEDSEVVQDAGRRAQEALANYDKEVNG